MKPFIAIIFIFASISAMADNADTIYVNDIVSYVVEEASAGSELIWKTNGAEIKSQSGNTITLSYPEAGEYSVMVCEKNEANCIGDFAQIDIVVIKKSEPEEPKPNDPEDPEIPEAPTEPEPPQPLEFAIEFPNIFTPNGDGLNDRYHINYTIRPDNFQICIFNRHGKKVFSATDPAFEWDGRNCSPDTYFYTAQFEHNGKIFNEKGSINLAREK